MKKIACIALALLGLQSVSAQETKKDSIMVHKDVKHFYIGFGAEYMDYKLNDKLKNSNLPQINPGAFELSIGVNHTSKHILSDLEWNTDYYTDRKTTGERVRLMATGIKWRPQYIITKTAGSIFAAGLDLSFVYNKVDIYTRGNVIDLNNLDPALHTGHISLYNNNMYLGPSASFGAFQNKAFPLRLTAGYEWNLARASWQSEFARVNNTAKESGTGRFYAKVIWYL